MLNVANNEANRKKKGPQGLGHWADGFACHYPVHVMLWTARLELKLVFLSRWPRWYLFLKLWRFHQPFGKRQPQRVDAYSMLMSPYGWFYVVLEEALNVKLHSPGHRVNPAAWRSPHDIFSGCCRLRFWRSWKVGNSNGKCPMTWEYWTSPYSSHYRPYTWWLGDVQWGHLMTHVGNSNRRSWLQTKHCMRKFDSFAKVSKTMQDRIHIGCQLSFHGPNVVAARNLKWSSWQQIRGCFQLYVTTLRFFG